MTTQKHQTQDSNVHIIKALLEALPTEEVEAVIEFLKARRDKELKSNRLDLKPV